MVFIEKRMDKSFLDNHPALQVIREDESDEENELVQIFPEHDDLNDRLSKNLYYGRETPSCDRLSLPITELCVDYFNIAGFDTTLTGKSDLSLTRSRLDRLDVARAAAVSRETCASPTSLVLALVYLERLRGSNPTYLHSVSSADLFLVSLLVASKLIHDDGEEDEVFNEDWAASAGMEKKDLNRLEIEFLSNIDWNCHVSPKMFDNMTDRLEKSVIQRQIDKRHGGWTTYSDISVLSKHIHLQLIWERLVNVALQVTAVCLAAYAASLMTMVGTCYALTKANLGPSAVSQSLNTIKSAASSSRTMVTPSVEHDPTTNKSVQDESIRDLSNMDTATLEHLISEETDTPSMLDLVNHSFERDQQQMNCQIDTFHNSIYSFRAENHKRKPPYATHHDETLYRENFDSKLNAITMNFSSNETIQKVKDAYLQHKNDDKASNLMMNSRFCASITSFQNYLSLSSLWKMDELLVISFPQDYNVQKSCSSGTCQNNMKNIFNDPLNSNLLLGSSRIHQGNSLFNHFGKTIIGV